MQHIPFLERGDLIYICSPAKRIQAFTTDIALQKMEEAGFRVMLSENIHQHDHYFSGTLEQRLSDLQFGLDHPEVKAIFSARGGYGIVQLLPLIDWTAFRKNPKWVVGFSDVTNLHLELGEMDFPSLHATMPLSYPENTPDSLSTIWQSLKGETYTLTSPTHPHNKKGTCTGLLTGGNLSIVYSLLGRTNPRFFQDKILFLEDLGENLYNFDRMIYALEFSGIFDRIAGVIFGGFTEIKDDKSVFGQSIEEILIRPFKNKSIPICFDFPAGHQNNNLALTFGKDVVFTVNENGASLSF
ncbi:MAG: LD-carboxypeptidase [Bacteroidetes bacterium]|nr:LD-carboxypeptidase [Bacteroidota bacterium]